MCSHLLLLLLPALLVEEVTGVITSQGMQRQGEEVEEREFEGWIQGNPSDYIMSAVSKRRVDNGPANTNTISNAFVDNSPVRSKTDISKLQFRKGPYPGLPGKVMGMYIVLADDTEQGYHTDEDWEPRLHPYQQDGANVLFFTFINPATMDVPISFLKLAATRGSEEDGAVPADTRIIFAIGGYEYSRRPNPWDWLTSRDKAELMAVKVARWRDDYGIDGIDLDLEEGAGGRKEAGPNMVHFVRKVKSIHPDLLVSQPTYGYPQVQGEIDVINAGWRPGGEPTGLLDSIGLMVYEKAEALRYVKNYAAGTSQWQGFPIKVDVPKSSILLGCKGASSSDTILTLARESVKQDLLGVMVWFCSVRNGLVYSKGWDCTDSGESQGAYVEAMEYLKQYID